MPEGFDFSSVEQGDRVLIKAHDEGGTKVADFVKQVGAGGTNGKPDHADSPEGSKDNSAFCGGAVQEKPHPLVEKIFERYGLEESEFMAYFCDGYSLGAVMLAYKTSLLDGSIPGELLAKREAGQPWGQIWKDSSFIGKNKIWHTPPGHLNRPDHAGGEE